MVQPYILTGSHVHTSANRISKMYKQERRIHSLASSAAEIQIRTNLASVTLSMMASDDDEAVDFASNIAAAHQEDVLALMNAPVGATSTGALRQEALPPLIEIFHDTEHFST